MFFYVQHLWGVGHVYRATRIARGMAQEGFEVHLIWGGTQIPGFDFSEINVHFLTPVRTSDVSFSQLLHADKRIFTNEDEANRTSQLLELFDEIEPDVLITEAFPFGRRQMLFELIPLLEAAASRHPRPLIVSSIRDIMTEGRKEKRVAESIGFVEKYFDLILVHGDESLVRIEKTLQGADRFMDKIRYTGLVTPAPVSAEIADEYACDVLVTVGGGAFGQELTRTALEAMPLCSRFPTNWLVSSGTELSDEEFAKLQADCPDGMKIVRFIPNLAEVMKQVRVSVSHSGYNTVADVLRSGCRSVLCPYADGKETEQLHRADLLSDHGLAVMILPDALTPENLAEAVEQAANLAPAHHHLELDGAETTARILKNHLGI